MPSAGFVPDSCLVYTPTALAEGMVRALKVKPADRVLEPCVGQGALLRALAVAGVKKSQVVGLDFQQEAGLWDASANVTRGVDFLRWSRLATQRFDKVIANPPYIAIERLQGTMREAACNVRSFGGLDVRASSNTWYAFFLASLGLLKPHGSLCFVLPAAWDFVNYAEQLRLRIGGFFEAVEIHRCRTPLFKATGIQDGSVVIIARRLNKPTKSIGAKKRERVVRFEHETPAELIKEIRRLRRTNSCEKVSQSALKGPTSGGCLQEIDEVKLEEAAAIGIGAVTGDASFFLMTEDQRIRLSLPVSCLRPVISRARHLVSPSINTKVWEQLRSSGERVWLFDPPPSALQHPAVKRYIRWGRKAGCDVLNQKIASRTPWYRAKLPPPPDGYLSGMSSFGPIICFRGMERLNATNTLYVVKFKPNLTLDGKGAISLALMSSRVTDRLSRIGRSYADGLIKYEPVDLRNLRIPRVSQASGAFATYARAAGALLDGRVDQARSIVDMWFSSRI
jgi:adenine-specific DNA-methyltransferase